MKHPFRSSRIACLLLVATLLLPHSVFAADIEIDAECNLADAIRAANWDTVVRDCPAGAGEDRIRLTGHITLEEALPPIQSPITIEGKGHTISGDNQFRIFHVAPGGLLTINRLTVIDASAEFGAAIVLDKGAIVTVNSSVFAGNRASGHELSYGGAIFNNEDGSLLINNSRFIDNSALDGGAIYSDGYSGIRGSTFRGNVASGRDFSTGGAIVNRAGSDIFTSTFQDNWAGSYGGAITNFGDLSIIRSKFSGNEAASAGALANVLGELDVVDGSFLDNRASVLDGGAIFNFSGTTQIFNSVVSGNSASNFGGGLLVRDGSVTADGLTVDGNSAEKGGGVYVYGDAEFRGRLHLRNSQISDSAGGDCIVDGALLEYVNNVIADGACITAPTGILAIDVLASKLVGAFDALTDDRGD